MGNRIDYTDLARLRELGMRNADIAARLGCSVGTIDHVVRKLGIPKRATGQPRQVDMQLLHELWGTDMRSAEIAARLGVSESTLLNIRRRHGIPPRSRRAIEEAVDPTPLEIEHRARECRERHYAERRAERDEKWEAA